MDHQALLRAVETSDCQVFVEWYEKTQTQNNLAVKESVDRLSKKDLCGIWTVFIKWVMEITKSLKETPAESPEKNVIVNSILVMSTMASYTISNMSNNQPQGLELSVKAMNGSLKFLTCKKAGTSICEMSERYWKVHPEFEIPFAVNTIHWLLTQALQPKATLASAKQVWNLKGSIEKMDATILESSGLLVLLLSSVSNSKFISAPEGRKCIACLFNFGPQIVQMVQKSVKKFIPIASVSECESLGEIYFKAWRMIPEERRADVEFSIQDLMYNAVVAYRKPLGTVDGGVNKVPMNKLLFHLLHALHRQRKQRTVAVLIHNLYKPILWRYLEASNGLVRANALCLFFDAFPFESGEGFEEDEVVRNKQWAIMLAALMDPVPLVRTIAIQGTCRILTEYWELVPVNIIQDFITCMLRKLLYDSSSADVRAHVVKGLVIMLDCKQTHTLLEKMIPLTNKVLHDPHEKVRAEYVSLLTHVQKLKVSKLWEVIEVNHLVVRLATDTSKNVCRRLVTLLAPFYCPKSTPEIVFQRCLRLVIDNREASRKFYQHIHGCVSIEQMAQLILIIWKFLRNHIHKQLQKNRQSNQRDETQQHQRTRAAKRIRKGEAAEGTSDTSGDEDKENQDVSTDSDREDGEGHEEFSEASIMGLIDVVCILVSGNKTKFKTPQNVVYWENIKSRFNKTCSLFFRYFRNSDGLRSVIYLYGLLSSTSSPMMLSFVKSQLKSLNDQATSKDFGHLVDAMCNWGRGEDLLDFISDHLQGSVTALMHEQSSVSGAQGGGKDTGKKRVSFERLSDEKPILGLRCMAYLLQHPYNKKIILRKNAAQIEQLCDSLQPITAVVEANPEKLSNKDDFLFVAASLYVKIVLVLNCAYKREEESHVKYEASQEKIFDILKWTSSLTVTHGYPNPLVGDLISSVVASISNLIMIHSMAWKVCRQFLDVVLEMVMRFPSSNNLTLAMNCAYHSLVFVWSERSIGNECDVECDDRIALIIKFVLECPNSAIAAGNTEQDVCLDEHDWPLLRDIVRKIMEECHRHNFNRNESLGIIIRNMVDILRQDMTQYQADDETNAMETSYQRQMTRAIIAAFRTKNVLAMSFLDEFFQVFKNDEDEMALPNLVGATRLMELLSKDKGRISSGTFAHAITSFEHWWSTVGEIEKSANPELASYVGATIKELKKVFSV